MAEKDGEEGHAPIIIKRITKVAGGHHGGAWKVAYADFVTAMMAFFLLLWLLATTTPVQRAGIAEYFTPTVGLKDSKGIGFQGGLTPNEVGTSRTSLTPPGLVAGQIKQGPQAAPPSPQQDTVSSEQQDSGASTILPEGAQAKAKDEKDAEALKKAEEAMQKMLEENAELQQMKKNIIITNTPEGLKIDVVDDPQKPIFLEGTATMTDNGRLIFRSISGVIVKTRNQISITGHTERSADAAGATYTSWELSADRANATRRFLTSNLLETKRVARVIGMSDKELLLPKEPLNPRNRRISIVLLRGTQLVDPKDMSSNRDLLSVPEVDTKKLAPKAPPPPPPKPTAPIEMPQPAAGSIFHNNGAKNAPEEKAPADEKDQNKQGPGFVAPKEVPPAPPPPPPKPKPAPVAAPAVPVELPETAPDDIFKQKKGANDVPADDAAAPAFAAPKDLPPVPPPKDQSPPPSAPLDTPVQLPESANPDALFAPDKQTGQGFKTPEE